MEHSNIWTNGDQSPAFLQELLLVSLKRSGVGAIMKEAGGSYMLVANLPDCWALPEVEVPTHRSVFGEELGAKLEQVAINAAASEEPVSLDISLATDDRHFTFFFERIEAGEKYYLLVTIVELTEEYRREQRLRALLRELSHRSKNLLAIVMSIAAHTARTTTSLTVFNRRFSGRIHSLSRSQDLVTDASWRGAHLRELVRAQAGKYVEQPQQALQITGENPLLDPNEALHIGLAVHELFVNAIALGDGGLPLPAIELSCRSDAPEGRGEMEICWHQQNPPGAADISDADGADTFGSAVLTRVAPTAIAGDAQYVDDGDTVTYRLTFRHTD